MKSSVYTTDEGRAPSSPSGLASRAASDCSTSTATLQDMVMIGPQQYTAIFWETTCLKIGPTPCKGADHNFLRQIFHDEVPEEVLFFVGFRGHENMVRNFLMPVCSASSAHW